MRRRTKSIGPFEIIQGPRISNHNETRKPIASFEECREVVTTIERIWTVIRSESLFKDLESNVNRVYDFEIEHMPDDNNFAQNKYYSPKRSRYFYNKSQSSAQEDKFDQIFSYIENDLTKDEVNLGNALELVRQGLPAKEVLLALIKSSDGNKSLTDTMLEINEGE